MNEGGQRVPRSLSSTWREASKRFRNHGHRTPDLDARILLGHVCDVSQAVLLTGDSGAIADDAFEIFEALVVRRLGGEPVSRIIGKRGFWKHDFLVSDATLDPRADSETLIDLVLRVVAHEGWERKPLSILDLGTGTGCLVLSLLDELPYAHGTGTDISEDTIATACANANRLGLDGRVNFAISNWFDSVTGPFDIIISNPPYIPNGAIHELMDDVRLFDPLVALDGGCDGLDAYRAIISGAHEVQKEGWLILECGIGQCDAVGQLLDRYNYVCPPEGPGHATDLGGVVRCVAGKAKSAPEVNAQKGESASNMVNSGRIVPGSRS